MTTQPFVLDLASVGLREVQQALADGTVTAVTLTAAYLARIDALSVGGPHLNSVRSINTGALTDAALLDAERAAGHLRGPLHGVPILVKDNIDVAGMPTTAGSIALAESYPSGDAPLVTRLRDAGAVILGKTNLTEFANFMTSGMPSGYSSLGGQVLNPYDASETPSGSSAGSGSAAASGLATLTVGTETSGSILSPARANSLAAVKPTVGLVSRTGIVPICATQDTAGPMTRFVYDSAALLTVLTAIDPADAATSANPSVGVDFVAGLSHTALRGARLGFLASEQPDDVYDRALSTLADRGAILVPVSLTEPTAAEILSLEFRRDLNAYLATLPATAPMHSMAEIIAFNTANAGSTLKFGQTQLIESAAIDLGDAATLSAYEAARDRSVREARDAIDSALKANKILAIVSNSGTIEVGARAGYPSVSVPSGYLAANRHPSAVTFLATAWSEQTLLSLAFDFEQAAAAWRSPEEINPALFARVSWDSDQQ